MDDRSVTVVNYKKKGGLLDTKCSNILKKDTFSEQDLRVKNISTCFSFPCISNSVESHCETTLNCSWCQEHKK